MGVLSDRTTLDGVKVSSSRPFGPVLDQAHVPQPTLQSTKPTPIRITSWTRHTDGPAVSRQGSPSTSPAQEFLALRR